MMDKEYIEKEAVREWFRPYGHTDEPILYEAITEFLDTEPAADVVEVVRCKDCKHWNEYALACDLLPWVDSSEHANWYAEDFRSYGERRDNNAAD